VSVVGAGKMSRLLLTHLASHGVTKINLLNRSRDRAEELAGDFPDLEVKVDVMDEFWGSMMRTDLAFTSTSATGCIVTKSDIEKRRIGKKCPLTGVEGVWGTEDNKLMYIDISMPRNVDAAVNEIPGQYAYNVDDLKQVVAENQAKRREKVLEAERLLRIEVQKFVQWQDSLKYVPTIAKLQSKFESVRIHELAKAQKKGLKGLSEKQLQAVDVVTKGILNKLLHGPMTYLRSDDHDSTKASVEEIEQLFQLIEKEKGATLEVRRQKVFDLLHDALDKTA
jgi:glutamyl-tRNA reductase